MSLSHPPPRFTGTHSGILGTFGLILEYKDGFHDIINPFLGCTSVVDLCHRVDQLSRLDALGIGAWVLLLLFSFYGIAIALKDLTRRDHD